jgi:hypothetical protein
MWLISKHLCEPVAVPSKVPLVGHISQSALAVIAIHATTNNGKPLAVMGASTVFLNLL